MAVTGQGPASSTVTRATLPSSWKTWVIPSFLARMADMKMRITYELVEAVGFQVARRISMSTPAGRWSRRCSESTVLGVGWWISIRRLCVRISKCSRESFSLNGERITQYTFFSVGSGTGPDTLAPVRVAVSTISFAADSIAEVSYAFRRMRILFCVADAIGVSSLLSVSDSLSFRPRWLPRGGQRKGGLRVVESASTSRHRAFRGPSSRIGLQYEHRPELPGRWVLLDDLGDYARADRATALSDGETQALVHGDRLDQFDLHLDVVPRHDHLDAVGQLGHAGDVGRAEVELRPVAREERGVTATLLLLQHVDLGLVLGVRRDRPRLAQHLAALDLLALGTAQQTADVVARLALVEDLAEHLNARDDRRGRVVDADDFHRVPRVDDALLDEARGDRATARDRENVLDG